MHYGRTYVYTQSAKPVTFFFTSPKSGEKKNRNLLFSSNNLGYLPNYRPQGFRSLRENFGLVKFLKFLYKLWLIVTQKLLNDFDCY